MTHEHQIDHWWEGHYRQIIDAITRGQIVPFLGADINLCDRPETAGGRLAGWQGDTYPPSNLELAIYLDEKASGFSYRQEVRCPLCDAEDINSLPEKCPLRQGAITKMALQHVSQYVYLKEGRTALCGALSELFERQYTPNSVHRFFAKLPKLMAGRGHSPPYQLLVTTCFDSTLEQAFREAQQEFDLVSFIGDPRKGYFEHQTPEGKKIKIDEPNTYLGLFKGKRPVILKLYGGYAEDFVITEDHYIDYLAHRETTELIPGSILSKLSDDSSTLWFLGYSPCYWNLRVILRRIWPNKISSIDKKWWAIQTNMEVLDRRIWNQYSVDIPPENNISLEDYIAELDNRLQQLPTKINALPLSSTQPARNQVFICCSQKDKDWLEDLQTFLEPLRRNHKIDIWDETKIPPGSDWREEVKTALTKAKVAVLLVSKDFIASDFIATQVLPSLLEQAQKEVTILWVYLKACLVEEEEFTRYQPAYDATRAVASLPEAQQDEALTEISRAISKALKA